MGKNMYMVGIGGIGMSALAQLYAHEGRDVAGSDSTASRVTDFLKEKGIVVSIGHRAENVPEDTACLIYSDAVPDDNAERIRARALGIPEVSYFEALGEISKEKYTIAVAGSHGKTTTTGMLAKILWDTGRSPTVIVGSIVKDFQNNFCAGESDLFVVEACEYKDHVLKLDSNILVLTNLEWDHTDYFPDLGALQKTFKEAIARIPKEGALVTNPCDSSIAPLLTSAQCDVVDYTKFSVGEISLIGEFNKMNARAAKAVARACDKNISEGEMDKALSVYQGSWRRFEYKGKMKNGADVYDDYAHHPTEIKSTLRAVRERFPKKKIIVAFHPHLYSRTRDLLEGFAGSFAGAKQVIIAPIFKARGESIDGVSSEILAEKISARGVPAEALPSFSRIEEFLKKNTDKDDIVITMGAGDIYKVAEEIVL